MAARLTDILTQISKTLSLAGKNIQGVCAEPTLLAIFNLQLTSPLFAELVENSHSSLDEIRRLNRRAEERIDNILEGFRGDRNYGNDNTNFVEYDAEDPTSEHSSQYRSSLRRMGTPEQSSRDHDPQEVSNSRGNSCPSQTPK